MTEQNIVYLLNVLREQSQCIDKQVACIITDKEDNLLSVGWNKVLECNKDCHNKATRICKVTHAEIVALHNLSKENKKKAHKAYVSLFPCAPCQNACKEYGIKEIISYTPKHKDQVFDNIIIRENVNDVLLKRDAVDTYNKIEFGEKELEGVIRSLRFLSNDVTMLKNAVLFSTDMTVKSIVEVELQLEQLKLMLWSINPELYNIVKRERENIRKEHMRKR